MNYKTSNRVYLWLFLLALFLGYILSQFFGESTLRNQIINLVPPIVALIACRKTEKPNEVLRFHKFRVSSVFMILLIVLMLDPLTDLLNAFSQLFVPNFISTNMGVMSNGSVSVPFMILAICIAPLFEEFIFRGVIFHGYEKSCGFLTAAILSAILFGAFHVNLNQFFYAAVLGFFLAMVVEATGSLIASMIMHLFYNFFSMLVAPVILGLIVNLLPDQVSNLLITESGNFGMGYFVIMLVLAAIFTPLVVLAVRWIARREGREHALVFRRNREEKEEESVRQNFVTPSLIIALILAVAATIWFMLPS